MKGGKGVEGEQERILEPTQINFPVFSGDKSPIIANCIREFLAPNLKARLPAQYHKLYCIFTYV